MTARQSGRTTRMLQEAKELAQAGRAVYVICANRSHVLALTADRGAELDALGVKFETVESVSIDWNTLRMLGAHPNCAVLIDHHAIERKFSAVLEMLHRYDASGCSGANNQNQGGK